MKKLWTYVFLCTSHQHKFCISNSLFYYIFQLGIELAAPSNTHIQQDTHHNSPFQLLWMKTSSLKFVSQFIKKYIMIFIPSVQLVFSGHSMHWVCPVWFWWNPIWQEKVVSIPWLGQKCPSSHSLHDVMFCSFWYDPGLHGNNWAVLLQWWPTGHVSGILRPCLSHLLPGSHDVHWIGRENQINFLHWNTISQTFPVFDCVSHYKYLSHIEVDWQDLNTDILSNKRVRWTFLPHHTFGRDYNYVFHHWYNNSRLDM